MATLTGLTKGGFTWEPKFIQEINKDTCLGCGRCYKVCARDVLRLQPLNEFGELIDEDDDDDIERQVMTIANPEKCIGCEACARVCPKKCQTHVPLPLPA
ncbi:MAG: ferredoxin III, nif-specific [Chroococcales cyanobacterium]